MSNLLQAKNYFLSHYRKYLDEFDLSEEDKLELVNLLSLMIQKVIDEKWGITGQKSDE